VQKKGARPRRSRYAACGVKDLYDLTIVSFSM